MTATVKPATNQYYVKDDASSKVKAYRTEMFCIQVGDYNGDKQRYEKFMHSLYPYDQESRFELNMSLGNPKTQTWTKEGDLLIFIEYLELELPERSGQSDPENKKY